MSSFSAITSRITSEISRMSLRRLAQNHRQNRALESRTDAPEKTSQKLGQFFLAERLTSEDSKTLLGYISKALSPNSNFAEIEELISKFNTEKALPPSFLKEDFQEINESKSSLFAATSKNSIPQNIQKIMTLLWLYSKNQTLLSPEYDHKEFGFEKFKSDLKNKSISDELEDNIFDDAVLEFILFKIQKDPEYNIPGLSSENEIFKDETTHRQISNLLLLAIKKNKINTVKLLLIYRKIDKNISDTFLLITAIKQETINLDIIIQLLQHGQIDINKEDEKGPPLYWAVKKGHPSIAEMLIATGDAVAIRKAYNHLKYRKIENMPMSNGQQECFNLLKSYNRLLMPLFLENPFLILHQDKLLAFINNLRQKFSFIPLEAKDISYIFLRTTLRGAIIRKMLQSGIKKEDGSLYTLRELREPGAPLKKVKLIKEKPPKKRELSPQEKFIKFLGQIH